MNKDAIILAYETSCDETSASIVSGGHQILANVISSQIEAHQKFGGVVPEVASRKHVENVVCVSREAFREAGCSFKDIDAVAVTYGPGLVGALLVGLSFGKAAAYTLDVPLIGVNHLIGHMYAGFLEDPKIKFPAVSLIASGGHTSIVYLNGHEQFEVLGQTRDDAAGEVLDKIARELGLGYPGGPQIEKTAQSGDPSAFDFPRAWLENGTYDFSYSGLKSAVLNFLNNARQRNESFSIEDVAASFQEAVMDVLVQKTALAVREKEVKTVILAGGVAANNRLRSLMADRLFRYNHNVKVVVPQMNLCTDNAAMIACAGYYKLINGKYSEMYLNAIPNLGIMSGE